MAGQTYKSGEMITKSGYGLTELKMITSGSVKAAFPGGSFLMKKGDVIGITDLSTEICSLTCTALEDTSVISYPVTTFKGLDILLKGHPEMARIFLISVFHQAQTLLVLCSRIGARVSALSSQARTDYETAKKIAKTNHISINEIPQLEIETDEALDDQADLWLAEYYLGFEKIYRLEGNSAAFQEMGVVSGHLRKAALDYTKTFYCVTELAEKSSFYEDMYFNESQEDLFGLLTGLYTKLAGADSDRKSLEFVLRDIINRFEASQILASRTDISSRINEYKASTKTSRSDAAGKTTDYSELPSELRGSMETILSYSGLDDELLTSIKSDLIAFRMLPDKNGSDEETNTLRKRVASHFTTLYKNISLRALGDETIPMSVRLFLYFGYIDEDMADIENAITLYEFAKALTSIQSKNVFTFFDWLKLIYNNKIMPSRDEFDSDYSDELRRMKASGEIDPIQYSRLMDDGRRKAEYELNNLFVNANKITFGRISTYCPIFVKENVLKTPEDSIVTAEKINSAIDRIRRIDPKAFYREGIEKTDNTAVAKEIFHREYLPNIILMPNMGTRSVLWQEIEGKVRNTPSRMLISIFHLENIFESVIRLTAEFRWEMTKRIQGPRWNDPIEHSLTGDYFNYVQFYKKNHDLSAEAKDRVKTALLRAKNSYKEMFVRDYASWIVYEAQGSPKLNKVARDILFTYCTFSAEIIKDLEMNPIYQDLISRMKIKQAGALHKIDLIEQKVKSQGLPIPAIVKEERAYIENHSRV